MFAPMSDTHNCCKFHTIVKNTRLDHFYCRTLLNNCHSNNACLLLQLTLHPHLQAAAEMTWSTVNVLAAGHHAFNLIFALSFASKAALAPCINAMANLSILMEAVFVRTNAQVNCCGLLCIVYY